MPFKVTDFNNDTDAILNIIEFIETDNLRYFRVKDENNLGFNVKYIPTTISNWDKEQCDLYIFENPYLTAENDVFEVYESSIGDERIGWIFPITILESNDNDFAEFKNLNNYKHIAYQKLLELDIKTTLQGTPDAFYSLSTFFRDKIICVLNKNTTAKISGFNINQYLLSFYQYGYLLPSERGISYKAIYNKEGFLKEMRSARRRVTLCKTKFDITANKFIYSLFAENLLQSDSYLVRFILLYQVIEDFIQKEFDRQFHQCLQNYQNDKLAKNDLRESIISMSKERELIKSVIGGIQFDEEVRNEFMQECKFLFTDIGYTPKTSLPDYIYDYRNLITHRLRSVTSKESSLLAITEVFERLITEILINYEPKQVLADETEDDKVFL